MWWGQAGFHPFWFFPWVFFLLLLAFLVLRVAGFRRYGWGCGYGYGGRFGGPSDAEAVLKRRLASGEIGEDDYRRLKELLGK